VSVALSAPQGALDAIPGEVVSDKAMNGLVELRLSSSVDAFGNGQWSASLATGEAGELIAGMDHFTTADRVALIAAIGGLSALRRRCAVELYTESRYLADGAVKWLPRWSMMEGKRADGRDKIRNHDRWAELHAVASRHDVQWHLINPKSKSSGSVVGRTGGEGSDIGILYCGTVPAWDASLGYYRTFTADELTDESICYHVDDTAEPLKPITRHEARLDLIARIAQNKLLQRKPP
jgi:ribonuclease HI